MLNMKWTLSAVMLAGSFAGIAPHAVAQSQYYRATFKLPVEARFGEVLLPAGTYTISAIEGAKGLRIRGEKGNVAILATGYESKPATAKARLTLVDSDGTYALRSFESGAMGGEFQFRVAERNVFGSVERAAIRPAIEIGVQ
jgi:hypothetical protein